MSATREARRESPRLVAIDSTIPLARSTPAELAADVNAVLASPVVDAVLNAVGGGVLVLNAHRQIVASNLQGLVPEHEVAARSALGLRPGEALGCIHALERTGGCGGSEACRTCGALKAILGCAAQRAPVEGECLVTAGNGELHPFELRLRASPVVVEGRPFVVLAIRDASDEKRRGMLERIFFHDLLNTVSGLSMSAEVLLRAPAERCRNVAERMARQVRQLEREILGQRTLLQAEHGTLGLTPSVVSTLSALRELAAVFAEHPLTASRALTISRSAEIEIHTDAALLMRVLINMATNALEATGEGGEVRAWCTADAACRWACVFHVHNDAVMPRSTAVHVFQRSFSTKAHRGRGLGTYSMKLLGERYLGGAVTFTSSEGEGTTFSLELPGRLPDDTSERSTPGPCF